MDYRSSGVNISSADKLVKWLKAHPPVVPQADKVLSGLGGYTGLFQAVFPDMKEPCLSACADGVGTKLKLAAHFQRYEEVGRDLVAMCVNDLICSGARPLFFMDYYACGKLRQKQARAFLNGVRKACEQSFCALLGGETAEMPDCYTGRYFDCAGFAVGVVDRSKILGAYKVKTGDRLIGVAADGFHSNGFSLLRKVFQKDLSKWEKELLRPTALYVSLALELFKKKGLKAIAHITGGGMDNILRILPDFTRAKLSKWAVPAPFLEAQKRAGISNLKMLKTFNCGVGLALAVSEDSCKPIQQTIKKQGFSYWDLGCVTAQKEQKPSWRI